MTPNRRRAFAPALIVSALVVVGVIALIGNGGSRKKTAGRPTLRSIHHIVVVYLENWSFVSLYGQFPGADGLANAGGAARQVDKAGAAYGQLPQPLANSAGSKPTNPAVAESVVAGQPASPPRLPDSRFPASLANRPFDIGRYVSPDGKTGDLLGRFYQEQAQIDGGKMDKFVSAGNSGGLPLDSYDVRSLPLGAPAAKYTLADRFFHAA